MPEQQRLPLKVSKTNEMIVDYRKRGETTPPIHIDGVAVEQVEIFKFLCVYITKDLK